jgi:hypothetical protein
LEVARRDPLKVQISHFLDVIRGDVSPRVSARDGYVNILVLDAIQRSIKAGCLVDVGS